MIRGMTRLNGDKGSAAGGADFIVGDYFTFYYGAVILRLNHARAQFNWLVGRRRAEQFDGVLSSDRARRVISSGFFHQVVGGRPIAMTIEQRADDAATQHPGKSFLISLGLKCRYDLIAAREAADVQAFFIGRPTAKARHIGRVGFLETFFVHQGLVLASLRLGVKPSHAKAPRRKDNIA